MKNGGRRVFRFAYASVIYDHFLSFFAAYKLHEIFQCIIGFQRRCFVCNIERSGKFVSIVDNVFRCSFYSADLYRFHRVVQRSERYISDRTLRSANTRKNYVRSVADCRVVGHLFQSDQFNERISRSGTIFTGQNADLAGSIKVSACGISAVAV